MADKIRLVVQTDDEVRAALRLEAARRDMEMSELADEILREALADAIEEIRKRRKSK
jgi:plasmid stability protein